MKKIILPKNHSALLLIVLSSFVAIPAFAAPQIECEEPKYDFGTVIGQDQITHDFIIWNRGDEPLVISKIKNCCGVETSVDPMTIFPGSNAVCTSVFNTKNRYGEQDKQILLITNDKKNLYYDLRMVGALLKPIEFSPRFVRLGNLMPDSVVSEAITATNLLDQAVTLESVSTTIPGLEAEVVNCRAGMVENLPATSGQEAGRSMTIPALQQTAGDNADRISALRRSWMIQLKSTGPFGVGQLNGQVQLNFSTGTVNVPVIGAVRPILQATPDKIQISPHASEKVERVAMLRSGDDRAFAVLSPKLESADGEVDFTKVADGKWKVKLTVHPDSIQPGASITNQTSIKSQSTISILLSCK